MPQDRNIKQLEDILFAKISEVELVHGREIKSINTCECSLCQLLVSLGKSDVIQRFLFGLIDISEPVILNNLLWQSFVMGFIIGETNAKVEDLENLVK